MDDVEERIRRRAYEIWEREGRPHGRESDHWLLAREEILRELPPAERAEATAQVPEQVPAGMPSAPPAKPAKGGQAAGGKPGKPAKPGKSGKDDTPAGRSARKKA